MTARTVLAISVLLAGCGGPAALSSAGPQSGRITGLWSLTFWICAVVYVVVVVLLVAAFARARRPTLAAPALTPDPRSERRLTGMIAAGVAVTALTVVGLVVASTLTARALGTLGSPQSLTVEVTGHQWWWEIEYWDAVPSQRARTANELHVPVGEPVLVKVRSFDVIHSLWVPPLHGKKDLVPGHPTSLWIQADAAGTYAGQCAEFCGYQHAKMAFLVVAEPPDAYEAWAAKQRSPAPNSSGDAERRGHDLFVNGTCAMCHAIEGTRAGARHAPNLTHLASRQTIAAGTLPNTTGHLAGWILDPQRIKPGANMPANPLSPDDLHALLAYLGTLK